MIKKYRWYLLCLSLLATSGHSGIRVLFEFDESGLRVHRVIKTSTPIVGTRLESMPQPGQARIYWLDESGVELAKSDLADPRLSYAPGGSGSVEHQSVLVREGAWLANGPDGASSATLYLPAHDGVGLSELLWTVFLPEAE